MPLDKRVQFDHHIWYKDPCNFVYGTKIKSLMMISSAEYGTIEHLDSR